MSYLLEVPVAGGNPILVEVTDPNVDDLVPASKPGAVIGRARTTLESALAELRPTMNALSEWAKSSAPDEFTVEFGLKLAESRSLTHPTQVIYADRGADVGRAATGSVSMTTDRLSKREIRELQQGTGLPYAEVARLKLALDEVLEREPRLTRFGFGVFHDRRKSAEQNREDFQYEREQLRRAGQSVIRVYHWLRQNITPIKTPTRSSYSMKHVAERAIGEYVSNGELIAAALMAGYPMSRSHGPNSLFGMSERDVDRARETSKARGPTRTTVR